MRLHWPGLVVAVLLGSTLSSVGLTQDTLALQDPLAVAARWSGAVEANDMVAFRALYAPDAVIWLSFNNRTYSLDEHLALVSAARARIDDWRYEEVRRQRTDDGFLQEHVVRGTARESGAAIETHAAVIATVVDGVIVRLHEYFTPSGTPGPVPAD